MGKLNIFTNSSGFSLAEVTIATGLLGLVVMNSYKLMDIGRVSSSKTEIQNEILLNKMMISNVLQNADDCEHNFGGNPTNLSSIANIEKLLPAGPPHKTIATRETTISTTRSNYLSAGQKVYISDMNLVEFQANEDEDTVNNTGEGEDEGSLFLEITYRPVASKLDSTNVEYRKYIQLYVILDGPGGVIESCSGVGTTEGIEAAQVEICPTGSGFASYRSSGVGLQTCAYFSAKMLESLFDKSATLSLCSGATAASLSSSDDGTECTFPPRDVTCVAPKFLIGFNTDGSEKCGP